jgi:hypothetical protein
MIKLKVIIATIALSLSACSAPLGTAALGSQAAQVNVVSQAIPLSVSPNNTTVSANSPMQLDATGGTLPYKFTLVSGDCQVASSSGLVEVGQAGTCTVSVEDGAQSVSIVTINASAGAVKTTYSWVQSAFGACTAACNGGQQIATVYCSANTGSLVADSFCPGAKPATIQSCNTTACPNTTGVGTWNDVTGSATASFSCVASYGFLLTGTGTGGTTNYTFPPSCSVVGTYCQVDSTNEVYECQ